MRIMLVIEYDGTNYAGWQRQANALSVQEVIENALHTLTQESIVITGASRTDAGVHALGQIAHFDTASRIPPDKYSYALNTLLPSDIRVRESRLVSDCFHARFSAARKLYRYVFHNAPHAGAMDRLYSAHVIYHMDETLLNDELKALIGTHDYSAFAASGLEAKTGVRTIYAAGITRRGETLELLVSGNGFLYNMVRIIAGTLITLSAGKIAPGAFIRAIETGNRLELGVTAPAKGLTLMEVDYNDTSSGADAPPSPQVNAE